MNCISFLSVYKDLSPGTLIKAGDNIDYYGDNFEKIYIPEGSILFLLKKIEKLEYKVLYIKFLYKNIIINYYHHLSTEHSLMFELI